MALLLILTRRMPCVVHYSTEKLNVQGFHCRIRNIQLSMSSCAMPHPFYFACVIHMIIIVIVDVFNFVVVYFALLFVRQAGVDQDRVAAVFVSDGQPPDRGRHVHNEYLNNLHNCPFYYVIIAVDRG